MTEEKKWISSKVLFSAIAELLAEGRQAAFTVTGMSMWPFLCHGRDQVIVEAVNPRDVRKGDIILFRATKEKYLLHRITELRPDAFETTGDGNCFRDGFFPYENITERVICLVRKDKKIDCRDWRWKMVFRAWMLLFPIRSQMFRAWKKIRKYKEL